MTKTEILEKILDTFKKNDEDYEARQKDPHTQEIVEAIRKVTNGEFVGMGGSTTLMGWTPNYDKEGRPLNCDPNYRDSSICIEEVSYPLTRVGWYAYIWLPKSNAGYTTCWSMQRNAKLLTKVDLRPDYVKEYEDEKKKDTPPMTTFEPYVDGEKIYHPKYGVGHIDDRWTKMHEEQGRYNEGKWVTVLWETSNGTTFSEIRYE